MSAPLRSLGAAAVVAAALSFAPAPPPAERGLAVGGLAVWDGAQWRTWWKGDAAPARWPGEHPVVAKAVSWRAVQPGLDVGSLRLAGSGEAWRFEVVLARIDPARFRFALHVRRAPDGRVLPWGVADTPREAEFAVNAGMFDMLGPWGWLVLDGSERQGPGTGPLSSAFVIDTSGAARVVSRDSIAAVRARGATRWAFQSYPTALEADGSVPLPLRASGRGVNVGHRDARLAVGTLRDGRVVVALTRFGAMGGTFGEVPLGPTLPEMTAVLGAVGMSRAVFLDGGISAQMSVRDVNGKLRAWEGLRRVPVALVAVRR